MSPLTNDYGVGDVICLVFFPFEENKSDGKPRFVICLEELEDSIFVVPLTKNLNRFDQYPKSIEIMKDSSEGKGMQIIYDSLIIPEKASVIRRIKAFKHGKCSQDLLDRLQYLCR